MTRSTTIDSSRQRLARVLAMVVTAALQAAGVSAQTPTSESHASPYCEPAERRAIPPGAWVPPYEGLALPADTAQLAARVSDADSTVWIDGNVLTIVRRDPRAPLMIVGTFFCPMNRIGDTDVWALRLRMAGWDGVRGERFESHMRFFLDEVLPWAERELGVSQERADRALHGASNGGGFVTAVGVRHAALCRSRSTRAATISSFGSLRSSTRCRASFRPRAEPTRRRVSSRARVVLMSLVSAEPRSIRRGLVSLRPGRITFCR